MYFFPLLHYAKLVLWIMKLNVKDKITLEENIDLGKVLDFRMVSSSLGCNLDIF